MSTFEVSNCVGWLTAMANFGHLPSLFMLRMSRPWQSQVLPGHIPLGEKQQCYQNAGMLALTIDGLTYVEGYACPAGLIPVQHAWCVDSEGRVVDNTWDDSEHAEYFGVAFTRNFLRKRTTENGFWGLFGERITLEVLEDGVFDNLHSPWPSSEESAKEIQAKIAEFRQGLSKSWPA